jgi:hypothetical protein
VADTWQAAERTFRSTLTLMERWPELHFGHSTPALYAWLERHRPALFAQIRAAMLLGTRPVNAAAQALGAEFSHSLLCPRLVRIIEQAAARV